MKYLCLILLSIFISCGSDNISNDTEKQPKEKRMEVTEHDYFSTHDYSIYHDKLTGEDYLICSRFDAGVAIIKLEKVEDKKEDK